MSDEPRNPFLLPPDRSEAASPAVPSGPPTPSAPTPPAPAPAPPAPAADPRSYIAVPASVESVTHRIARPDPAPAASESVEDTRVAAPRRWLLLLPGGGRVGLAGPLLLGRDPAAIPDRTDAGLMPVLDPGKTVSKTHALLEPVSDGILVRDLHSTNGVAIDTLAGRQLLSAGGDGVAPLGATIMLGSYPVVVATG